MSARRTKRQCPEHGVCALTPEPTIGGADEELASSSDDSLPLSKRQRRIDGDMTPSSSDGDDDCALSSTLAQATRVLAIEAAALASVCRLYETDGVMRDNMLRAVEKILQSQRLRAKLIVCGVGKSGYIAQKLVATMKSLGIRSSFLHAAEAIHGDLGDVDEADTILFVSFSGKTPELLSLLPHFPKTTTVMALTGRVKFEDCALLRDYDRDILLSAPVIESEEASFGVSAPTTSTTVALAVADTLALTVAERIHGHRERMKEVFQRNHPGGAIGVSHQSVQTLKKAQVELEVVELPSPSISAESED